jgi:S1-C subfamily serine protease
MGSSDYRCAPRLAGLRALLVLVVLSAGPAIPEFASADKARRSELIEPDQPVTGTVSAPPGNPRYVDYRILIPDDAFLISVELSDAPADLDLFLLQPDGTVLAASERTVFNETLRVGRMDSPSLPSGYLQVRVAYQYARAPLHEGRGLQEIPYTLTARLVRLAPTARLTPGRHVAGVLEPDGGMAQLYEIRVPPGTDVLRLDITDTRGDLDLFVNRASVPVDPATAEYSAQSIRSTETLIIDGDSSPPLGEGRYMVLVVDQVSSAFPTPYSLHVHDDASAPPRIRRDTTVPDAGDGLPGAMHATVEVLVGGGGGSGVVVGPRGHVLTNRHVVLADSGVIPEMVTIGFTTDPGRPTAEAFQARVLDTDAERDLALLRIVSGRYGEPLDPSVRFPYLEFRDAPTPRIGDELRFIGYPTIGGTGSRPTITMTSGMVSGFQEVPFGRLIKTDGIVNEGSSGGAAVDRSYHLIGFPTEVVGLDSTQIAYIYPVALIPGRWKAIIHGE